MERLEPVKMSATQSLSGRVGMWRGGVLELDVPDRAVVEAGVAEDVAQGVGFSDVPARLFPDADFDFVLSWNVIHHGTLGDLGRRLGEIWRVLRPAGLLQATVLSTRDANYGIGRAIAPDTFVIDQVERKRPPALLLRCRDARRSACRL
jgi:hypothetical protein